MGSSGRKKKIGSSLKRLFSTGSRRNSGSGLENEYLPTPSSPNEAFRTPTLSLPSTPTKTPQNPFFRHNSESRSFKPPLMRQHSQPNTPCGTERRDNLKTRIIKDQQNHL